MKRCRNCIYYKIRFGCINLEVLKNNNVSFCNSETVAIIPSHYEIYKKTKCLYFKNKN